MEHEIVRRAFCVGVVIGAFAGFCVAAWVRAWCERKREDETTKYIDEERNTWSGGGGCPL